MAKLTRDQWYDLARRLDWQLSYVSEDEAFPEAMTGGRQGVPTEEWWTWDEPYKITYRDYVKNQHEKDAAAYAVQAAVRRSQMYDQLDEGWHSALKAHYGAIPLAEYAAAVGEARMARFGRAAAWRNVSTFGCLDEVRHGQIQLIFPHEYIGKDAQYDWAHKTFHTNEWGAIAARLIFDDMFTGNNALDTAIQLTFAFETGFTNLQFLGMAADAMEIGDVNFSSLISSIQTDEARHSQIGTPVPQVLMKHDPEYAQYLVDKSFWLSWRLIHTLTGISMDYYTPLEHRRMSFKEFIEEWIIDQFLRNTADLGLRKPWYWDRFLRELDQVSHALHLVGIWYWRPTVWWNPKAGIAPAERRWLNEKYPGWDESWGQLWDVIIRNVQEGELDLTLPLTFPMLCSLDQLPICEARPGTIEPHVLDYQGRRYCFCSDVCRWIFEREPEKFAGHTTLIDRFLAGEIQPPTLEGALAYMGLTPETMGQDAENYAWVEAYRQAVGAI